ncbi:C40 family peptidase [Streptomyces palmae]|uniref:NlpC/P60 family protein n=1 Tax=Streptomyces palmae TaxID=1701085 RepID=A0A4Z0GK27_9ACTN|nr:C40 family peptidase [Streptomyces palmae]TGA96682.1 NlpC/P60 family protein [Streptomyces palmae]
MASHRKLKRRPLSGGTRLTARTAATLALAGAATAVTASAGSAQADTRLTPAQVRAKVAEYHQEAEEVTERYNGARERAESARAAYESLRDEAARKTQRLNAARGALGSYAAAQYRAGGLSPTLQAAFSERPDTFLDHATAATRAADRQGAAVTRVARQMRGLRQVRAEAGGRLAELNRSRSELARHKRTIEAKLASADRLLHRLTAEQRRALTDGGTGHRAATGGPLRSHTTHGSGRAHPGAGGLADGVAREALGHLLTPGKAPSGRAARAVSYAYGALGKPYVWGATGPSGYDCSGLTQAAWKAAGVALPRTTYTQINAGTRVSRGHLAPGDLVFFYSGVSHVGIYIGDGRMIHAPHPGAPVRIAPIDQMPFSGAVRPA